MLFTRLIFVFLSTVSLLTTVSASVPKKYRVGITAHDIHDEWWAIIHHVLFMYDTIEHSETWEPVLLMHADTSGVVDIRGKMYRAAPMDTCVHTLVIGSSRSIQSNLRACPDTHVVYFNQGPTYFQTHTNLLDNTYTKRPRIDTVWTTPQYNWQASFVKEIMGASASFPAPYVWDPRISTHRFTPVIPGSTNRSTNRVGVYETNRGIYKMSLMPMLIVEKAHREKPLAHAEAYGLGRLDTDAFRKHVLSGFEAPWKTSKSMAKLPQQWNAERIGTVVSHTLRNGLNYLWLEALHSGLALVHNSEHMPEGCGYYYPGENITAGAEALQRAVETHDAAEAERQRQKCLWPFSTSNPVNVEWYERLLDETLTGQ